MHRPVKSDNNGNWIVGKRWAGVVLPIISFLIFAGGLVFGSGAKFATIKSDIKKNTEQICANDASAKERDRVLTDELVTMKRERREDFTQLQRSIDEVKAILMQRGR